MQKYKNVFMIFLALILFVYAGFISIFPAFVIKTFNIDEFEQKSYTATGLNITLGYIDIKIKPNFKTVIIVRDLIAKYPDNQPLLEAKYAELTTTPASILKKEFKIKSLYLKNVEYHDQILPDGENKIAYLPAAFDPSYYGTKKITIVPGPIRIKNLDVSYTVGEPYSYKTTSKREITFEKSEVEEFLSNLTFTNVVIK